MYPKAHPKALMNSETGKVLKELAYTPKKKFSYLNYIIKSCQNM